MKKNHTSRRCGFSLVEVVLALGICSFAMVAIVGMIPVGLSTFRDAMDATAQSQIVQRLASDILLTDFSDLESRSYYYNEKGSLLAGASPEGAPDLAYTARIETREITGPGAVSATSGKSIQIRIARTHPGQQFEDIENKSPSQIYTYPVIVANTQEVSKQRYGR